MGALLSGSFESFKETLLSIPVEEAKPQLFERIEKTKEDLVRVLRDTDDEAKRKAVAYFSLLMMAKEAAEKEPTHNPFKEASWVSVAQQELQDFAGASSSRSGVLETVLFDEDDQRRRKYAARVSASVEPRGEYDNRSFAVGVALGEIALNDEIILGRRTAFIS